MLITLIVKKRIGGGGGKAVSRLVATGELQTESNAQGKSTIDRGQAQMVNYSLVVLKTFARENLIWFKKITGLWGKTKLQTMR